MPSMTSANSMRPAALQPRAEIGLVASAELCPTIPGSIRIGHEGKAESKLTHHAVRAFDKQYPWFDTTKYNVGEGPM